MEKLQIAVFGGGYWGKNLIKNFCASEDGEVKIVCDLNKEVLRKIKSEFSFLDVTTDFKNVLKEDSIDGVAIATPPSLHYPVAREALIAKKHTWVEKPLSMRIKEGEELVNLAKKENLVLFVDETFLYDPALRIVKEVIDSEKLGKIYHLLFQRLGMGRIRCDSNVWWNSAPHDLSILRYLMPIPIKSISLRCFSYLQNGIEDVAWASLELKDGISACINLSWFYPHSTANVTVIGSKGAIYYEGRFKARKVSLYQYELGSPPKRKADGVPSPNFIPITAKLQEEITDFGKHPPLEIACKHFLDCIRKKKEPLSSGQNSLKVLRLLEAGETSKNEGGKLIIVQEEL
jgi:predicted dehydrogenase